MYYKWVNCVKKQWWMGIFVIFLSVFVFQAQGNLISNAGFEIGYGANIDSWTIWNSAVVIESWANYVGSNGVAMQGWTAGGGIYQDIPCAGRSNYTFTAYGYKDADFTNSLTAEMKLEFRTAADELLDSETLILTGTTAWAEYEINAESPSNTFLVRVVLAFSGTAGSDGAFKFDELDLTSTPGPIPVTRYVSLTGGHVAPYTNWVTAATDIQSAIDASSDGDEIVVTNGVYDSGGRAVYVSAIYGSMTNRIVVDKEVTVRSVNGPAVTTIAGQGYMGKSAVRCAYLADHAQLHGFTLTNGHTMALGDSGMALSGGGIWCDSEGVLISNCVITHCQAKSRGGGAYGGCFIDSSIMNNYVEEENWAQGGGAVLAVLSNCTIKANTSASSGGGLYNCEALNCRIEENVAVNGGGSYRTTNITCTIVSNSAEYQGGGSYEGRNENCIISDNKADYQGGAVYRGTHRTCFIARNEAGFGGGASYATLQNCTVVDNQSIFNAGGVRECMAENSIIYFNTSVADADNWSGGTFTNCCVTPDPGGGANTDADPGFPALDNPHLVTNSPCVNAGTNASWMGTAVDVDGQARVSDGTVDMGCDEVIAGTSGGSISVAASAAMPVSIVGVPLEFTAEIQDIVNGYVWQWDDGEAVTNQTLPSHAFSAPGDYAVVLTAWNDTDTSSVTIHVHVASSYTTYVSPSGSATAPYTNWMMAANDIQHAIDACAYQGEVLVSNGVYDAGSRIVMGDMPNRIVVDRPVSVRSVNGPASTIIEGQGPNGVDAIRCAYVINGASLSGFTLTNGATLNTGSGHHEQSGGGVWCESGAVVSNCMITGNHAEQQGAGVFQGFVVDCEIMGNTVRYYGGGCCSSVVQRCVLAYNQGIGGGGVYRSTVDQSRIVSNNAGSGGGAQYSTLNHCTIAQNTAEVSGGGVHQSSVYNSFIVDNVSSNFGGGAYDSALHNCTVSHNYANESGGGVYSGSNVNSIIYFNGAFSEGANWYYSDLLQCCTTPDPGGVGNVTNQPGMLSSLVPYLSSNSVCINAGTNKSWMTGAVDLEGESRIADGCVDIGCDEYMAYTPTGTFSVAFGTRYTKLVLGQPFECESRITGKASAFAWSWGDGGSDSANAWASHTYSSPGIYDVVLSAWDSDGALAQTVVVEVVSGYTNYVSLTGTHIYPYTSWATAATTIQAAVHVNVGGSVIVVDDGTYHVDGDVVHAPLMNRVVLTNTVHLKSLNGPDVTIIEGQGPGGDDAVRCVYAGQNSTLSGFTVSSGHTMTNGDWYLHRSGGGIWCEEGVVISNCIITGNATHNLGSGGGVYNGVILNSMLQNNNSYCGGGACGSELHNCLVRDNDATYGGGVYGADITDSVICNNSGKYGGGTSYCDNRGCIISSNTTGILGGGSHYGTNINCLIINNVGTNDSTCGGGIYFGVARHCTIVGNHADIGGGMGFATVFNSILYYNTSDDAGTENYRYGSHGFEQYDGSLFYSCSTPISKVTDPPLFVDQAGGDYRLMPNSPCVDAGTNRGIVVDFDGNIRPQDGNYDGHNVVDMGACEYMPFATDSDHDGLIDGEEVSIYGSNPLLSDSDADGMIDGDEVIAGTSLTNGTSVLEMEATATPQGEAEGLVIAWSSIAGKTYTLMRSTDLSVGFSDVQSLIAATPPINSYTDTVATATGPYFYRIKVDQ